MTDIQLFNLNWLCYAMTAPNGSQEHYYYDGQTYKFFYTSPTAEGGGCFDMVHLKIGKGAASDLLKRLGQIDHEDSEIVEIPRLNVQDKVSIQLLFLSKLPGILHGDNLRLAVEGQPEAHGFALDKLLTQNDALTPVEPYWENFKLKTIQYYLEKFTGVTGIALKLIN